MKILEIIRLEEALSGTLGILKIDKECFCWTLEPPDRENARNISSIPAQQYICEIYHSPKHGETYQIFDVPGRAAILFHAGNTVGHTAGCILLGGRVGKLKGERAVLNSGRTFKQFMDKLLPDDQLHLTIKEEF
jgi:hypothetical protein